MQHTSMAEQPQTHYVANAGNAERERGLVPVRWVCPGRRYDGVVHLVSSGTRRHSRTGWQGDSVVAQQDSGETVAGDPPGRPR